MGICGALLSLLDTFHTSLRLGIYIHHASRCLSSCVAISLLYKMLLFLSFATTSPSLIRFVLLYTKSTYPILISAYCVVILSGPIQLCAGALGIRELHILMELVSRRVSKPGNRYIKEVYGKFLIFLTLSLISLYHMLYDRSITNIKMIECPPMDSEDSP